MSNLERWINAAVREDEVFLANNRDLIDSTIQGWTVLHSAAHRGHERVVARILLEAPDLVRVHCNGLTALHCAATEGHEKVVAQLLEVCPQMVDTVSCLGATALHYAVRNGDQQVAIVKRLLACSPALVDRADSRGNSPLHDAVRHNQRAIAELLVATKPDIVFAVDKERNNILHVIRNKNDEEFIARLLEWNPQGLCEANAHGKIPLHVMINYSVSLAVEIMQVKLSLDEVVRVFDDCFERGTESKKARLWSLVKRECADLLLMYLGRDVFGLVGEFVLTTEYLQTPHKRSHEEL